MNILLLNLTRFGDLLQSQAAITDLTDKGHNVSVVCLGNFAQAGGLLRGVRQVFPFKGAATLKLFDMAREDLARSASASGWRHALADVASWRDSLLQEFSPDIVCNLTPALPARLLSLFLAGNGRGAGFTVNEHGYGVNSSAWAAFMQGAAYSRGVSPFNIVDIFRNIAVSELDNPDGTVASGAAVAGNASLLDPPKDVYAATMTALHAQAPEGCKGFVCLQLGASDDIRRWPVASFASLGRQIWEKERLCPVLLGSKEEAHLAAEYASLASHPFISLCGRTDLQELAAALLAGRMLITNDTGTMHLAAGLGVPVLSLFLATAQPFDTGPYLAGSCCLEPNMDCHPCAFGTACGHAEACRRKIDAGLVASLALGYLRSNRWLPPQSAVGPAAPARIWESEYDNHGFMSLRSLSGHDGEARSAWLMLQRRLIRPFLDRTPHADFHLQLAPETAIIHSRFGVETAATVSRAAALIEVMLQQGNVLLQRPVPLMHQRFLATWDKIRDTLKKSPQCGSLSLLWNQETQAEGQDLPDVLHRARDFAQLLKAFEAILK